MNRVTIAAHESMMDAANMTHVAMGKAKLPNSYQGAGYEGGGNLYAVSSGLWHDAQIQGVQAVGQLMAGGMSAADALAQVLPDYDGFHEAYGDEGVALVGQAAQAFRIWTPQPDEDGGTILGPAAAVNTITAVAHPDPQEALGWLGVVRTEDSEV